MSSAWPLLSRAALARRSTPIERMKKRFAALIVLLVSGLPRVAFAQVELQMSVSAREVSVGEGVEVRLDAMSSDDEVPASPELIVPNSFELRGPSVGTRQQMSITGFNMVTQKGISASWVVTPTRPGLYTLGPGSVRVGGRLEQAETVQLRVLPEGQQPRRRARRSVDPFDTFDPFGRNGFDDLFDRLRGGGSAFDRLPAAPLELIPEHAPDPLAFLATKLDVRRAVVGEQVTLSIYAHGAQGLFQEAPGAREPTHPDFIAQRLVEDGSRQPVYQYELDGQRWIVVKIRELALFPLRPGRLEVGPLEFGFLGRRYGIRDGLGLRRTTRTLSIDVEEPPLAGRPPGYAGDVGVFEVTATVEPRSVPLGGSVAVTARVAGSGRLPGALKLPERSGLAWLEPTIKDEVSVTGTRLGGTRTFSYLVRASEPGSIDLGNLRLPLYDPRTGTYRVVEAALGSVNVEPAAPAAHAAPVDTAPARPKLSALVAFRPALGPARARSFWADSAAFWWLLVAGPSAILATLGVSELSRRLRRRLVQREDSPATHARRALIEAREALGQSELARVASALERAIYGAIEWSTGVKARAYMRSELRAALEAQGLTQSLAERSVELLDRTARVRLGAANASEVQAAIQETEALVKELVRRPAAAAQSRTPGAEVRA